MLIKRCANQISIFLFLFTGITMAQQRTSDFGLTGRVKNIQSATYAYSTPAQTEVSGFLGNEKFDSISLKFDQKENLVFQENFLDYQGELGLFDRTVFQFNFNNQVEKLETTLIQNGEEPKKISQRKKFYYIQNQLVRIDEFNSGRTTDQFWVTNFIYEGGRLKKKEFWMEDEIFSVSEFENRLMKITSEKTFHNDGKPGRSIDYKYDENAKLILKSTKSGNEKTDETFEYENGKLVSHITKNNDRIILKEMFNSDELPKEIQKLNYRTQKFDLYEFKFEYDSQNNWINCLILENQTPKFTVKRKIDYY